jgi:hypothetical protein
MNEPLPIWHDESSAGSLFSHARPLPTKWIATDYEPVATADEFRARERSDAARREARREMERSPEAQEVRWREEREKALAEMRRERRQERVAAGIEAQGAEPDWAGYCTEWVDEVTRGFFSLAAGFQQTAAQFAEMERAMRDMRVISFGPFIPDDQPHKSIAQVCDDLTAMDANGGWLRQPIKRTAPAKPPKARPDRDRYLPGTRHAGRRPR